MALCLYFLMIPHGVKAETPLIVVPFGSYDMEVYVTPACNPISPTGIISVVLNGGDGPFEIMLFQQSDQPIRQHLLPSGNNSHLFEAMQSGVYRVRVSDAFCAVAEAEVEVGEVFTVKAEITDICLQGTGKISLEVSGGSQPFTYRWSNDRSTLPSISGKNSGTYSVTITDNNGCSVVKEYEIKVRKLDVSLIVSKPKLCRVEDGTDMEVVVQNGKEPYTYLWNSGETAKLIQNKKEGIYQVLVKDNEGCDGASSFEVERDVIIFPVGTLANLNTILKHDCQNFSKGSIYVNNFPGSGLTYEWEYQGNILAPNARVLNNISAGLYCVTATANNSCQASACFEIKNISVIATNPVQHIACGSKGSIGLVEPLPYFDDPEIQQFSTYKWSHDPNYTHSSATDLADGSYSVTIANSHPQLSSSCANRIYEYRIQQFSPISITGTVTNGLQGPNVIPPTGKIEIQVSGGSGDYSYKWRLLNTTQIISTNPNLLDVPSGSYEIEVSDNITNCILKKVFNVHNFSCNSNLFSIHAIFKDPHNQCSLEGQGPVNNNFNDCSIGCPKRFKIILNIFSNQAFPLKARVTGPNGYNEEIILFREDLINGHTFYWPKKLNVSLTPYTLLITDRCNNAVEQEFWACAPCDSPIKSGNFITFSSGVVIELVRVNECKFRSPVFAENSKFKIVGDVNIPKGLEVTITWPNGRTAKYRNFGSNPTQKVSGSVTTFDLNESLFDGRPLKIKETRSDGCVQEIELRLGIKSRDVKMMKRIPSEPPFNAFTANEICEKCNPTESIDPPKYVETCADKDRLPMVVFKYKPYNWNAPCSGGGSFVAHVVENKKVLENIPVICSQSALITTAAYYPIRPGDELTVADGGGCLFNTLPTFGFVSQTPVYVNWWRILRTTNPFPPDHDTSGPSSCPKITVTSNGDNFLINTENEKSGVILIIIYPDKTEKSYTLGYGFDEFTVKKIMAGQYEFILKAPQPCTDKIIKASHDGESLECPGVDDIRIIKFTNTIIEFQLNSKITQSKGKVRIIRDIDNSVIGQSDFNLIVGVNNLSVKLNIVAPYDLTMIIEIPGCAKIEAHFPLGAFTSDDPPVSDISPDCDDDILNLVYDSVNNNYEFYWVNQTDDTYHAFGAKVNANSLEESNPLLIFKHHLANPINGILIKAGAFVYIFGENNYNGSLTTIDTGGNEHTQLFPDRIWSSVVQSYAEKTLRILYYSKTESVYYTEVIDYDGRIIRSEPVYVLGCNPGRESCARYTLHNNGIFTAIDNTGSHTQITWYDNTDKLRDAILPVDVVVKNVQPWQNNQWLVSGNVQGQVTLSNGRTYDTEGYHNPIFIWYDDQAGITDVKLIRRDRHEILTHSASDALSRVAYTGIYTDTISYSDDPDLVETESCIFGDGFVKDSIPDSTCPAVTSVDTDDYNCFTIYLDTDSTTQVQIRYDYYGVIDQDYGILYTETIPYTLSAQGDSVQYCRHLNTEHFYWSIDYSIECTTCSEDCELSGNLMFLAKPSGDKNPGMSDKMLSLPRLTERTRSTAEPIYFPNPFQKGLNLAIDTDNELVVVIRVWDSFGSSVMIKELNLKPGPHIYFIEETEKLRAGVYIFELQSEVMKSVKRVIKLE